MTVEVVARRRRAGARGPRRTGSQRGVGDRDLGGEPGVGDDQVAVDAAGLAVRALVEGGEDERRHGLADDTAARGPPRRSLRSGRPRRGSRPAGDRRGSRCRRAASARLRRARPRRARRHGPRPVARPPPRRRAAACRRRSRATGTAERLEQLDRRADVEQRLHARRDDQRRDARAGAEVGRDVGRGREAAVDATEPTGPHEADADRLCGSERAADRRRTDRTLDGAHREVARPELASVRLEAARARPR